MRAGRVAQGYCRADRRDGRCGPGGSGGHSPVGVPETSNARRVCAPAPLELSVDSRIRSSSDQRITERDLAEAGMMLTGSDLDTALLKARSSYSESIGAPRIPSVQWDDVGGLAAVKADILDTIQLPLEHPELFADGLKKRSGTQSRRHPFDADNVRRDSAVRPARHGQDAARQGGGDVVRAQLLLGEGPGAAEHVHRRVGGERAAGVPARAGRAAVRDILRRAGLGRAEAGQPRRRGRRHGPHRVAAAGGARRDGGRDGRGGRVRHRGHEPAGPPGPRAAPAREVRPRARARTPLFLTRRAGSTACCTWA